MCRFLLARFEKPIDPQPLLRDFAVMCQRSRAPDGDWQGDGYGIAWQKDSQWHLHKSLKPIWQDEDIFSKVGATNLLVAHSRSAGFPQHKGIIDYNQPFVKDTMCFVFNGMIKGVRLNIPLEGKIGAQKIFSLLLKEAKNNNTEEALQNVRTLILANSLKIEGMNIGLVHKGRLYSFCEYADNTNYFNLHFVQKSGLSLICSQPLSGYRWKRMSKGQVFTV